MLTIVKKFWTEEDGQGLTEYGLILGLIAVVVIGALVLLGEQINEVFGKITEKLPGEGDS